MRGGAAALALTLLMAGAAAAQGAGGAPVPAGPGEAERDVPRQSGADPATPSAGGTAAPPGGAPAAAVSPQSDFQSDVLTIDQDALYAGSRWGQRMRATLEARSRAVQTENDRIAAALEAEDDALTALRPTLDPDEFRRRADAFDAKVQQVRQERDRAGNAVLAEAEADRNAFLDAVLPLLGQVMGEHGAVAILDRRTVFLSADSVDVTQVMIERVDAQLGDGPTKAPPSAEDQPATPEAVNSGNGATVTPPAESVPADRPAPPPAAPPAQNPAPPASP